MRSKHRVSVVRGTALAIVTFVACVAATPGLGAAEPHGGFHGGVHGAPHFEGRAPEHWGGHETPHWGRGDIRGFREHDVERWRAGHWFHGEHYGRLGWWWVVDGDWLFYPYPIYPYPDPYVPPGLVAQAPGVWYYCPSLQQYYPYVTECPGAWQPVVTPP